MPPMKPMHSLREFQRICAAAILDRGFAGRAPGIRANGVSPMERLAIYRNNVFQNYRRSLVATYPAVERLVGAGYFARLCDDYVRRHRSRSGDVGEQAAWFADYLCCHPVVRDYVYLPDVARLEWAIEGAFNASDASPLDLSRLAEVAPEHYPSVRMCLAASARLLASPYPVERIRAFALADEGDRAAASEGREVQPTRPPTLDEGAVYLLVRRERYAVVVDTLARPAHAMLQALQMGQPLGEALAAAHALDAAFDPGADLQAWLQRGVLVDFCLAAEAYAP